MSKRVVNADVEDEDIPRFTVMCVVTFVDGIAKVFVCPFDKMPERVQKRTLDFCRSDLLAQVQFYKYCEEKLINGLTISDHFSEIDQRSFAIVQEQTLCFVFVETCPTTYQKYHKWIEELPTQNERNAKKVAF